MREWPSLVGRRFADVLLMFEAAMPLGVRPAATGEVVLNPPDDYMLVQGGLLCRPDCSRPQQNMRKECRWACSRAQPERELAKFTPTSTCWHFPSDVSPIAQNAAGAQMCE